MSSRSILGFVALAVISLVGALAPPAGAVAPTDQTTAQLTPETAVKPLVGDFNGDGADDVLWYGRGLNPDSLWFNSPVDPDTPDGHLDSFTITPVAINGNYTPVVGDFNGDLIDDVFWYQAGLGADSVWFFKADKTFTSVAQSVSGYYRPIVGNFVANSATEGGVFAPERDDIFWYPLNTANSSLSTGNANKTFSVRSFGARPPRGAKTLVGQFEHGSGTPTDDILFYVPGRIKDSMWISDGVGNFDRTIMAINGQFRPVVGDFDQQGTRRDMPAEAVGSYGTPGNEVHDAAVDACWNGDLAACDDLHIVTDELLPDLADYHYYAETCGYRRSPGGPNCAATVTIPPRPVGLTDIVWHGIGTRPDKLWINNGNGFDVHGVTIGGNPVATVVPNSANGPVGGDRIVWNSLAGDETVWVLRPGGTSFNSYNVPDRAGSQRALAADFTALDLDAQYQQNEVLWYSPGDGVDQRESLWLQPGGAWT